MRIIRSNGPINQKILSQIARQENHFRGRKRGAMEAGDRDPNCRSCKGNSADKRQKSIKDTTWR